MHTESPSIFADDDGVFIREVERAIASQPGDGPNTRYCLRLRHPMGQMGIQRSSLLLARQVLYIARGHDRLWLRLIKLQGNGGSDVTSHDVSVKVSDMNHKYLSASRC